VTTPRRHALGSRRARIHQLRFPALTDISRTRVLKVQRNISALLAISHTAHHFSQIGHVAGHLNFDIPSFLDHTLTACRTKTGAFVAPPGTAVALDDAETDLRRADFASPALDRRHQRMRCASAPEIRMYPHSHQVNNREVMWITAAGHEPTRFASCFKNERHTGSQPPPPILCCPGQLTLIARTKGPRRIDERLRRKALNTASSPITARLTSNRISLSISFAMMSMRPLELYSRSMRSN
jgi:hypothetical protein